jgi:hypothetical protein
MNSKWLLDSYLLETSYHEDMSKVLLDLGYEYEVEKYIPMLGRANNIHFSDDDCVVMYGSIGFIKITQKVENLFRELIFKINLSKACAT